MDIREKLKGRGTQLICGWCREVFYADTEKTTGGFIPIIHCGHILPGSKKEPTGNIVGRKHFHTAYKNGDVAG